MITENQTRNRQQAALSGTFQNVGTRADVYQTHIYQNFKRTKYQAQADLQNPLESNSVENQLRISQVLEFRQPSQRLGQTASWLFDALIELESMVKTARDDRTEIPNQKTLEIAEHVIRACDAHGLASPIIDLRENGGVDVFCKEGDRGLLVVVNPDNLLQVFGDFGGEAWRARYDLSGNVWQSHLVAFLQELRPLQSRLRA